MDAITCTKAGAKYVNLAHRAQDPVISVVVRFVANRTVSECIDDKIMFLSSKVEFGTFCQVLVIRE